MRAGSFLRFISYPGNQGRACIKRAEIIIEKIIEFLSIKVFMRHKRN